MSAEAAEGEDLETDRSALENRSNEELEFSSIDAGSSVLTRAENMDVVVNGKVNTATNDHENDGNLLEDAKNTRLEARSIYADGMNGNLLRGAENSVIDTGHLTTSIASSLLKESKNSVLKVDSAHISGVSSPSDGSLMMAKDLNPTFRMDEELMAEHTDESATIFTESDIDKTTQFKGDWDELENLIDQRTSQGYWQPLNVFDIGDKMYSVDSITRRMEKLKSMYDQVEDQVEEYQDLKETIEGFQLSGSNSDKFIQLKKLDETLADYAEEEWSLSEDSSQELLDSDTVYISRMIEETDPDDSDLFPDQGFEEWFLQNFVKDKRPEESERLQKLLFEVEGAESRYQFEREYRLDDLGSGSEVDEDVQQAYYSKGLDLLDRVLENEVNYEFDEITLENNDELQDIQSSIDELVEQKQGLQQSIAEDPETTYEDVKDDLKEFEAEIEELEDQKLESYVEDVAESHGVDIEDPSRGGLETVLNQVKQHALPDNSSPWIEARDISDELEAEGSDVSSQEVSVSMYQKNGEFPATKDYQCCVFKDGQLEEEFPRWLADPYTQMLEIENGENSAMAITRVGETEDGNYSLVVDSVETSSNMFRDEEEIAELSAQAIEEFAENAKYENGNETIEFDEVVYNTDPHNSGAEQFVEGLNDSKYEEGKFRAEKKGESVYSEAGFPNIDGYRLGLNSSEQEAKAIAD